jgi:nitrogen fixation/metabolism regulation signal transduction histidine kinase
LHLSNADIAHYENRELNVQRAIYKFVKELTKSLLQLPFFLPGLVFHWPIYVMGKVSAKYEKFEESQAQNKIVLGLLWLIISYLSLFFAIWLMILFTPLGFVLAAGAVFIFAWYHIALVDR